MMSKRVLGLLCLAGFFAVSLLFLFRQLDISAELFSHLPDKSAQGSFKQNHKNTRSDQSESQELSHLDDDDDPESGDLRESGYRQNKGSKDDKSLHLAASKICDRARHSDEFNDTVSKIVKVLNRTDCVKCFTEFHRIRSLNLNRQKISELRPLLFFERLEDLNLSQNDIVDPGVLSGLSDLRKLDLSQNEISDPGRIARIKTLSILNIRKNDLDSLTGFSKLTELKILDSQDNRIADLNPLKKSHTLTDAQFWGNPVERHRPRSLCPRGTGVAKVIHDFCTAHHRIKISRADYSKPAYPEVNRPIRLRSSKRYDVFPGGSVEIWSVNFETKKILARVLDDWIDLATKAKKFEYMSESARISTLMRTYITEDDDDPDQDDRADDDSMFLVAVANRKIQALALIAEDEKINYAMNLKFLTVAPHNLGIDIGEASFKYVGSSVVEKALEITGKITLEPGSPSSSTAYIRMGFTSLSKDQPLSELGDGIIKGDQARSLSEKLKALRAQQP